MRGRIVGIFVVIAAVMMGMQNESFAHHALEYIDVESSILPEKGEAVFYLKYDYFVDDRNEPSLDHWEITPGIAYGILTNLMFDIHTHFAKFGPRHIIDDPKHERYKQDGPPPFIEAIAASLQVGTLRPKRVPIGLSALLTYEYPLPRSRELLDGQHAIEGTLIFSWYFGSEHSNATFNITFGKDGDETIKSFSVGAKTPITRDPHGISAGFELSFEDIGDIPNTWSILPGVYAPIGENVIFKTGLQFGKISLRTHVSLLYRF